jgi:NAD-dependent deacetylase sirtuin 2
MGRYPGHRVRVVGTEMDFELFCEEVSRNIKDIYKIDPDAPETSTPILCRSCDEPLVKPSTVLFGRNLPDEFWNCMRKDMPSLDLLIVAGTSLVVAPANCSIYHAPGTAKRAIINRDKVGQELGIDYSNSKDTRDLFLQGSCDDIFLELIQELGWVGPSLTLTRCLNPVRNWSRPLGIEFLVNY